MQTLLLACYVCLQLTTSPDIKSACDQCVTGLFEQGGISSSLQQAYASNNALKEVLEQKLNIVLPLESITTQDEEVGQESSLAKQSVMSQITQKKASRKTLIKAREEETEKEIQAKSEEIAAKLKNYEAELNDDLVTFIKTRSEEISDQVTKYKDGLDLDLAIFTQIKHDMLALDIAEIKHDVANTGHGDTLENCKALVARDSLVSKNGKYKATMLKSGELVITNKRGTVLKKLGTPNKTSLDYILLMQPDCNLVIYDNDSGEAKWANGVYDSENGSGCYLKIHNNGELAVYNQGQKVWTA